MKLYDYLFDQFEVYRASGEQDDDHHESLIIGNNISSVNETKIDSRGKQTKSSVCHKNIIRRINITENNKWTVNDYPISHNIYAYNSYGTFYIDITDCTIEKYSSGIVQLFLNDEPHKIIVDANDEAQIFQLSTVQNVNIETLKLLDVLYQRLYNIYQGKPLAFAGIVELLAYDIDLSNNKLVKS